MVFLALGQVSNTGQCPSWPRAPTSQPACPPTGTAREVWGLHLSSCSQQTPRPLSACPPLWSRPANGSLGLAVPWGRYGGESWWASDQPPVQLGLQRAPPTLWVPGPPAALQGPPSGLAEAASLHGPHRVWGMADENLRVNPAPRPWATGGDQPQAGGGPPCPAAWSSLGGYPPSGGSRTHLRSPVTSQTRGGHPHVKVLEKSCGRGFSVCQDGRAAGSSQRGQCAQA